MPGYSGRGFEKCGIGWFVMGFVVFLSSFVEEFNYVLKGDLLEGFCE